MATCRRGGIGLAGFIATYVPVTLVTSLLSFVVLGIDDEFHCAD